MEHVVQTSGGLGSWATGRRVVAHYGTENVHFLFADVLIEDDDLYRFLIETTAHIMGVEAGDLAAEALALPPLETHMNERREALAGLRAAANDRIPGLRWVAEGRDPWQVFHDVRFIGNSRIDSCSMTLKRDFLRAHMEEHFDPMNTVVYIGIDWTEEARFERAAPRWEPWVLSAPMCSPPFVSKDDLAKDLANQGIKLPRLYELGFAHNNCGGFCIKAGKGHFKMFYEQLPERYAHHAEKELETREYLQKDIAILRDRSLAVRAASVGVSPEETMKYGGGHVVKRTGRRVPSVVPLPMVDLAYGLQCGRDDIDPDDVGGCGCAL